MSAVLEASHIVGGITLSRHRAGGATLHHAGEPLLDGARVEPIEPPRWDGHAWSYTVRIARGRDRRDVTLRGPDLYDDPAAAIASLGAGRIAPRLAARIADALVELCWIHPDDTREW